MFVQMTNKDIDNKYKRIQEKLDRITRNQMAEDLIKGIEKLKRETIEETGAYKYNFAYEEVIELIKKYISKNETENK